MHLQEHNKKSTSMVLQRCRQGWGGEHGGLKLPPDFKLMLLSVQALTTKGHLKSIIVEKQECKQQLSGPVLHTKLRSVQIYELDPSGLAPQLLKSCLRACVGQVDLLQLSCQGREG